MRRHPDDGGGDGSTHDRVRQLASLFCRFCEARPAGVLSGLMLWSPRYVVTAGANVSTRNTVITAVIRRSHGLVPSAASGSTQTMYHGTSHARLTSNASVDHPAPTSQSRRRRNW